ncbi:hypothetical protein E9529_20760 [Blastococcus sp. KM273128]|uniref:hypothetical protein n=1 Tax=Blastococcus sp. KM273128 TaxID=2570314 RepID=UPI001F340F8E|nr:hypothetical protein [Blastococcus sp. KM273128]MCF6746658.1 hypothetical protein [Blastococcus sp. KM273128]
MPDQGLPRGLAGQPLGDGIGVDARVDLPQHSGQPVQVLSDCGRGDVDIAGGAAPTCAYGGVAADGHIGDAVAFEHRQDRLGVELVRLGSPASLTAGAARPASTRAIEHGALGIEGTEAVASPHTVRTISNRAPYPFQHYKRRSAAYSVEDHRPQVTLGEFAMYYDI